jgi:hypothetical protein
MFALVGLSVFMNWPAAAYFEDRARGADAAYFAIQIYESGTGDSTKNGVDVGVLCIFAVSTGAVILGALSATLA